MLRAPVVLPLIALTAGLAAGLATVSIRAQKQAPAPAAAAQSVPPAPGAGGPAAPALVDNERLTVRRATQPAGTIEKPHTHPEADYLSIQLTPGDLVVTVGGVTTKGTPGMAWYFPKGTTHTMNNVGTTPVDVIVVALK